MSISMYQAFIPGAVRALENLTDILNKVAAHAEARKIDPAIFINARLAPDMFPLSRQVQIASDTVKGGAARLAGEEPPKYDDFETTFPELVARLAKTIDYLRSFKPAQIAGSEERPVVIKTRTGELNFNGQSYLTGFVLPNLYFHVTTAYAIARHNGVELGKKDYLGKAG
ncbi:DUF1993 domain-containing protein [Uliginosibacterium sp. H3]|uniref:DUF1993 domain-containing protein n=1 Tax=Uliginosibacterium silvisoli TaxID=3114758 RepID=A0ABU6K7S5_9RHOO|nr:DUF1993 domain-containing protein [Uliginosibacterium sp. H3]